MKAIIIYTSVHRGSTAKVARAMAEALQAELVGLKDAKSDSGALNGYDLIGFGSGTYGGDMHGDMRDFQDGLPRNDGQKAFVFATNTFGMAALNAKAVKRLENRGYTVVGNFACKGYYDLPPFRFFGGLNKTRPNAADLQKAREFAAKLASK